MTSQPSASPLGILLLIAMIYLVVVSPKKLRTLGRMAIAFVITVGTIIVVGAIVRKGDPEALGRIAALVGELAAVIAGWQHTRSLKRSSPQPSAPPPVKP